MNIHTRLLPGCLAAALPLLLLCSCVDKGKKNDAPPPAEAALAAPQQHRTVVEPSLLPTRFRQSGYMVSEEKDNNSSAGSGSSLDGLQLKVGANITTNAPIPLREAMKAIVKTKNMSLSWAPDVDQELLVDIDVTPNDNFYEAIDNILRQLDYFHEVEGSTLVIKYRETKQYQIAMPFFRQYYDTSTGSVAGSLKNKPWENKFDQWEIIKENLDSLIATWSASVATPAQPPPPTVEPKDQKKTADAKGGEEETVLAPLARRVSSTDSTYTIDKPVGLITVNAPKSLQKRIGDYIAALEKELYKQILIEAKIIEVQLSDSSSLGINWNMLLENMSFNGLYYGKNKTYNRDSGDENTTSATVDFSDTTTDSSSKDSSTAYKLDGTSNQKDGSSSSTTKKGETIADNESTYATGEGKNLDNLSSKFKSTLTGSLNSESSANELNAASSSLDSSSKSTARTVTDALSMGTTAATFLTSASGLSEAISTGVTLTGFNFTSFIKALQEQGQTSILSNPKISVMNGQPALISVGRNVTYIKEVKTTTEGDSGAMSSDVTTAEILSGVGLALSAVVKRDNEIVMHLVPITSELSGEIQYVEIGQGNRIGLPVVNKREISTTVKIKDGSMLVVGGLISETDTKDGSYLPGAKNIPYLKYLFGYEEKMKTKRELIILLRPRIIN
ncbi:MAG: hypothetical protein ACTFAL_11045 [Candidatus Electronema sp. V4]|uniref:hypothetical protein n=1 Tax=Candidatus Electronema sp. V4 TaxID=3454756 RepID=UPI00405597E3